MERPGGESGGNNHLALREGEVPPLRYLGGAVEHEPKIRVIFWGSNWNQEPGSALRTQLLKMYEGLSNSAYQGILTQYFDPESYIGKSPAVTSVTDIQGAAPTNVNTASIESEIRYGESHLGTHNIETQYEVIPAPGSTYESSFTGNFCAFHNVDSHGAVYSFVPYVGDEPFKPLCEGYGGSAKTKQEWLDKATSLLASHEYAESATDPLWDTSPGWKDLEGQEVSDLCATPGDKLPNGSFVQGQYDDHQNACSLSDENPPHVLALTDTATSVTKSAATLNATINPESLATTYHFEYGTTKSYGSSVPATEASAGSGKSNVQVSQQISGLQMETTYHYRVVATNSSGTTYGEDRTVIPSRWIATDPPEEGSWSESWLNGISCATSTSCMAVGYYYNEANLALSYQLTGGQWVRRTISVGEGYRAPYLSGVSCTAVSSCTAVGYAEETKSGRYVPLIVKWNGSSWSQQAVSLPEGSLEGELRGVSCVSGSEECVAVGNRKTLSGVWVGYSVRWINGAWSVLSTPTSEESTLTVIENVSCGAVKSCMAVGWYNTGEGAFPFSEAWNGSSWTLQTRNEYGALYGVTCTTAEFCMASGESDGEPAIETWNGSKWSLASTPSLSDVWAGYLASVSCISPSSCTAVGAGWDHMNGKVTLAERWDGVSWKEETTPRESELARNELSGVSCTAGWGCVAAGASKASGHWQSRVETRHTEFVTGSFSSSFGSYGSAGGNAKSPLGATTDTSGNLWIADSGNNRVDEFNPKGEFVLTFGKEVNKTRTEGGGSEAEKNLCTAASGNVCQAGKAGNANGQLKEPRDIAFTSGGNLWVTESGNDRVQEFTQKGEYLKKFGSEGTGQGQFSEPWGIAISSGGNIWVSDARYYRVEEFNSIGEFMREVHGAGQGGSGNAEFVHPTGIAIDREGYVWVVDCRNGRVQELSSTGEYVGQLGTKGSGEGQVYEPEGIAINEAGDLLVTDTGNHRVEEFTPGGEYVTQYGGSGTGQFSYPVGVAVGRGGAEFVTDDSSERVEKWYQPAPAEATTQAASSIKLTEATLNGTVYPGDTETTYRFEYGTSTAYGTSVPIPSGSAGSGTESVAESSVVTGLKQETTYHFRIVASNGYGGTVYGKDATFTTPYPTPTYVNSFGTKGTGSGQFKHPGDVGIDPKGNLWVPDWNANRVEEFNEKGEYVRQFGTKGTGNGQLSEPAALAVDPKGNVWVADSGNYRVEEFNEKGEYVSQFGSLGTGNGQFAGSGPEGIAVDAKGNVWVSDTFDGRLEEFTENGTFIKAVGSKGSGAGQIGEPEGLAIGPGGNVWVADWTNNRVEEFSEAGQFVRQFGSEGTGNGQFIRPYGIEVESKGRVWVTDKGNRVQGFNEAGEYVTQFGSAGTGGGQLGLVVPVGLASDNRGDIWVTDPGSNRVEKWVIPGIAPTYASSFGSTGTGNGQFKHPADVGVDPKGNVWVADKENNRVEEFNEKGEYVRQFGSLGSGNGQLNGPTALAVDSKGNVWALDKGNYRVEEFNEAGEYVRQFGSKGTENGQFGGNGPEGIAVDSKGDVWVSDTYGGRVEEFSENGTFLASIGSKGTEAGQIGEPQGLAIGPGGNLWVADWSNNRVEEFNEAGEYVRQFGSAGQNFGQLSHPYGIDIDSKGHVWVADKENNRVEEFSETGEYLSQFGYTGTEAGQFFFSFPIGLASDSKGDIWVTDPGANRVERWVVPG